MNNDVLNTIRVVLNSLANFEYEVTNIDDTQINVSIKGFSFKHDPTKAKTHLRTVLGRDYDVNLKEDYISIKYDPI